MLRLPTALAWESRSFFHRLFLNTYKVIFVKYIYVELSTKVLKKSDKVTLFFAIGAAASARKCK
jgi:hypothetical protein